MVGAQWTLANMWFIGAGMILVTLLLIAGAISSTDTSASTRTVSTSAYKLTVMVSGFYLVVASLPAVARFQYSVSAFKTAAWIPAIQGVVALLPGRLFAPSSR